MSEHSTETAFPPPSLRRFNKVVIVLQRLGWAIGTMRLLTVPGRVSGKPRTTPISPLTVDGERYVIGGYAKADWVKNARAAGRGVLARGRKRAHVRLIEVDQAEARPVMRAFPTEVPHGVEMFIKTGVVADGTPDAFEAAAPSVVVFRIEPDRPT